MTFRHRLIGDEQGKRDTTNIRSIKKHREFQGSVVPKEVINKCFDFAYIMATRSLHRETRSGGKYSRTQLEVFWDTFSGKIAECLAYLYFKNLITQVSELDFAVYTRGKMGYF